MVTVFDRLYSTLPKSLVWKAQLMFTGVKYTDALTEAVNEGAAPGFWPYRMLSADGSGQFRQVPYLFKLADAVARVRVNDKSNYEVRRSSNEFALWCDEQLLCPVEFVPKHSWASFRTQDGSTYAESGIEQLGDMLVVNLTPGCEYFLTKSNCKFCGYGRFSPKTQALGQLPGQILPQILTVDRMSEVLANASKSGEARHVYIVGGSTMSPEDEVERFVPVIKAARKAVGDRLHVTARSGGGPRRFASVPRCRSRFVLLQLGDMGPGHLRSGVPRKSQERRAGSLDQGFDGRRRCVRLGQSGVGLRRGLGSTAAGARHVGRWNAGKYSRGSRISAGSRDHATLFSTVAGGRHSVCGIGRHLSGGLSQPGV